MLAAAHNIQCGDHKAVMQKLLDKTDLNIKSKVVSLLRKNVRVDTQYMYLQSNALSSFQLKCPIVHVFLHVCIIVSLFPK